jgi:hypothetical protein
MKQKKKNERAKEERKEKRKTRIFVYFKDIFLLEFPSMVM